MIQKLGIYSAWRYCHSLSLFPSSPVTFIIPQTPSLPFSIHLPDALGLSLHSLTPDCPTHLHTCSQFSLLLCSCLGWPGFSHPPPHLHLIPSLVTHYMYWSTLIFPFPDWQICLCCFVTLLLSFGYHIPCTLLPLSRDPVTCNLPACLPAFLPWFFDEPSLPVRTAFLVLMLILMQTCWAIHW